MKVNSDRIIHELQEYNTHMEQHEDFLLQVVKGEDGRAYVRPMPRSSMSYWQKFLSLFGWSSYNLNNVLEVLQSVQVPDGKRAVMDQTASYLWQKVDGHYHNHTQKSVVQKIDRINSLKTDKAAATLGAQGQNLAETIVEKSYVPLRTHVVLDYGPNMPQFAKDAFSVKKSFWNRSYIEPNPKLIALFSHPAFSRDSYIYEDVVASLQNAWVKNPDDLLAYVKANPRNIEMMFRNNPVEFYISLIGTAELTESQSELLTLLPIQTLKVAGNLERKANDTLRKLHEILPSMKALSSVQGTYTRYLPNRPSDSNFYEAFRNLTKLSLRMRLDDFYHVVKIPNLKEFHWEVENDSETATSENTKILKEARNLEEITITGRLKGGDYQVAEVLANLPENCKRVRLCEVKLDLTNKDLINRFRSSQIDTLYLFDYDDATVQKIKESKIAKEIVIESGPGSYLRYG